MVELYTDNLITEKTFNEIFDIDWNGISIGGTTGMLDNSTIVGATIVGGSFKTSESGARLETFPEWNKTIGMIVYDSGETEVFKMIVDGTDEGDVTVGDYSGGAGLKYDKSAGTFDVKAILSASSLHIPDQDTTANSFHTNSSGDSWWGATETSFNNNNDNATAYILKTGVAKFQSITVVNATVTTPTITGGTLAIGSSNNIFKADANGIYLGNATFGSAPFRVTMAGALVATSATITGAITISSGSGIANLSDTGSLAVLDEVGASNVDTTIIDGGKIITGLLTATNIQTGTLTGRKIQTQTGNPKVVMEVSGTYSNQIIFYNNTGFIVGGLTNFSSSLNIWTGVGAGTGTDIRAGDYSVMYLSNIAGTSTGGNIRCNANLYPNTTNQYDLGTSSYYWGHLYLSAGGEIFVGSTTHLLRLNQRDFGANDAAGFDNLGDTLPQGTGLWDLGNGSHKFNLYYGGVTACDLPTYNSALPVLKKIKNPEVLDSHFGTKQYFKEDEFPEEILYTDKRTGNKLVEGFHMIGFLVQVVRELNDKIEDLELKINK